MPSTYGGIILCGGLSTRMGRPKAWLPLGDEVFLQRIARILGEVVSPIVVVAAQGQELPSLAAHIEVVRDEYEQLGPLAGLAAGLAALGDRVTAAYATSCDVPLLQPAFVQAMLAAFDAANSRNNGCDLAIPRDGQFYHPLAAVYRTDLLVRVRALLEAQRLRPLFLVDESHALKISTEDLRAADPDLRSLRNANTPEEYAAILATLLP